MMVRSDHTHGEIRETATSVSRSLRPASRYLMTRLAFSRKLFAVSSAPISLAVFRLITTSNFIGYSRADWLVLRPSRSEATRHAKNSDVPLLSLSHNTDEYRLACIVQLL